MEYKHRVQRWSGKSFVEEWSSSTSYYSMGAYLDGDGDIDDTDVDTLGELYKLWQDAKAGDACCGESGWKYRFYRHKIIEEKNPLSGKLQFSDYVTPGKVYRRGKKVFFKAIYE